MKKANKKIHSSKRKTSKSNIMIYRYMAIGFIALVVVFAGRFLVGAFTTEHVLGDSIGPVLLADHGSGDSGSSVGSGSSGDSGSGGSGSSGESSGGSHTDSGGSGSGDTSSNGSTSGDSHSSASGVSLSGSVPVDCVGPDGRHFTTTFSDCKNLYEQWNRSNFSFTPLTINSPKSSHNDTVENATSSGEQEQENSTILDVETNHHGEFNIAQEGTQIHIETSDSGLVVKAQKPDGTEVELNNEDALDSLNQSLKDSGVTLSQSSESGLFIAKNHVEAHTNFPVSIDTTTHALTITTPSGTKTVAILPDQAVNAVLSAKLLTSIASVGNIGTDSANQSTTLTELNSEPVFQINGVAEKHLLGIFPVGFAKTTFVSATNGSVVKIDESVLNRLLESISF